MEDVDNTANVYRIKDIKFFGSPRRILLQSANGPCPLLAICNILLLRNQINISSDARYITFDECVQLVTNFLFDVNAGVSGGDSTSSQAATVRENLGSCLEILPKLNVGLDVNCKFGGTKEFEYTQEMVVFDLTDIRLFHGWVVSDQDEKAHKAFAHLSYNQVVEKLIAYEDAQQRLLSSPAGASPGEGGGEDESAACAAAAAPEASPTSESPDVDTQAAIADGILIKEFMDRTGSQFSYEGLLELHRDVRERELAVFFRNSHFNAMLKYQGDLFLLCTDIAFGSSHFCWEKLDEVDGDTSYCDVDFRFSTAGDEESAAIAAAQAMQDSELAGSGGDRTADEQAALDTMMAWQLQQEESMQAQQQQARPVQPQAVRPQQAPQEVVPGYVVGRVQPGVPPAAAPAPAAPGAAPQAKAKKSMLPKLPKGKSCTLQ